MPPEAYAALIAGSLSLAAALGMRWFETRARSSAWEREDRQRFSHEKLDAYADFLARCQRHVVRREREGFTSEDYLGFVASQQAVLLLAPKQLVKPAQDLLGFTLDIAAAPAATQADLKKWATDTASFTDEARKDLGADD